MKQFVCQDTNVAEANTSPYTSDGNQIGRHSPVVEWKCSPHFQNSGLYPAVNFYERLLHFGRDTSPSDGFDLLVKHLETLKLASPDVVPLFASLLSLPVDEKFPSLELSPVREKARAVSSPQGMASCLL